MKNRWMATGVVMIAAGVAAFAQQSPARPMSAEGSAQVQVLGQWVKPAAARPRFVWFGPQLRQGGQ